MNYLDIIQSSIDYIEENIKAEISAEELAKKSGFSLFHYYRLFQSIIGMPVMQYIVRRKLINAIYEISCGEKMLDTALSYGFSTHAGFFKAFKREYGCSPTQYLNKYKVIRPYKINLKQEEHIMVTDKKLREVLANWELQAPVSIKSLYYESSGNKSENAWIVNEDYVIKVGTNVSGLKQHIVLSKALVEAGLEMAVPICTKDKKDYFIDGELYFYLSNRIKGECIKSSEIYIGDFQGKSRYLGEVIGQLHQVLKLHDKEIVCNEPNLYETIKNWAIPEVRKYIELPESFYSDYLEYFGQLYPDLPRQVIHRDPNPSNIIMKDGKLAGFIDFELSERNVRIYDPCYAATAILSENFVGSSKEKLQQWLSIFKNIIFGYDSVCKLSEKEKQAIPYIIYSIQMICVAYFSSLDKFKELAEANQKMLKWIYDNREELNTVMS